MCPVDKISKSGFIGWTNLSIFVATLGLKKAENEEWQAEEEVMKWKQKRK